MSSYYELTGLTPYRAAFLHLTLIGVPLYFGLLPSELLREQLFMVPEACFQMYNIECTGTELFSLQDVAWRFQLYYQLAWTVWFLMRKTQDIIVSFHKILLACSATTVAFLYWLQGRDDVVAPLVDPFFTNMVRYHGLAALISLWIILTYSSSRINSMKWSIPANSLFSGGVVNLFVATAAFQSFFEQSGIEKHYSMRQLVTGPVRSCFLVAALYSTLHGILLLRIRYFLNVKQLRAVCFYKLWVNLLMPLVWFPERNTSILQVDQRITMSIRIYMIVAYLVGFWWAGKAEGISHILTSEKDE